MAIKQMIMSMKPLSGSELEKAKANQAVREAQKKEQQVKRVVGVDKVESEADNAIRASAEVSIPPALLAKVGRNEKLTTKEQQELASFFKAVGWL